MAEKLELLILEPLLPIIVDVSSVPSPEYIILLSSPPIIDEWSVEKMKLLAPPIILETPTAHSAPI